LKTEKRVALVTGAGQGIGRGIALALAREGYALAGNDIRYEENLTESGLFEVKARVEEGGGEFLPLPGDIADFSDQEKMVSAVLDRFGRIDVLVNNAGVAPLERKDVLEAAAESYDRVMSINTRGPFFLTQRVARTMLGQEQAASGPPPCVVFISSISAEVSSPTRAEYCISKAGVSQMARIFAHRLASEGINVYELRPGIFRTEMTEAVRERYDRVISEGLVPQKRWGLPEDAGKAVASLVRGDFAYATGLVVEISGGMQIRRL
jgi:NAD(P)-dependent dehydrogenase (short-subunit alcohol dehydrogenase family)